MRAFLATVLSVIAVGVLLIAYGLLTPRGAAADAYPYARPMLASERVGDIDDGYGNPYAGSVRQPLPRFALGRWEASAECDNMLAQGYTQMTTREGQALLLPAFRSFRGGVSVQF